jgi:hypothetical protein
MKLPEKAAIICMYCFGALLLAASIRWPMGTDQGIFSWVGDVIVRGGLPYSDAWDTKGIAAFYTYAFSQSVFGRAIWGIRVLDMVLMLVTMVALFGLLKRFCNSVGAWIGPILLLILHYSRGYWHTAQPDGWAGMFVVIGMALTMRAKPMSDWGRVGAGALVGLAAMYKMFFAGFVVPLFVYDFFIQKGDVRKRIMVSLLIPTGCVFVYGVSILWFWAQGGLADFVDVQFGFNPTVYRAVGEGSWRRFSDIAADSYDALVFFAVLGLCRVMVKRRLLGISLMIYLLLAFGCVFLQKKYFAYHFIPCDAPIVILYSLGLSWAYDILKKVRMSEGLRTLLRVCILLSVVFICWWGYGRTYRRGVANRFELIFPLKPSGLSFSQLLDEYLEGDFSRLGSHQVADYVKKNTSVDDYVLVWGFDSLIYYLSGRQAPTRFGFNFPLVAQEGTEYHNRYRNEFMMDIQGNKPKYIVVVDADINSVMSRTSKEHFESFTEFSDYVRANYTLERRIENFDVWRRK